MKQDGFYEIDFLELLRAIWNKLWLIILIGILTMVGSAGVAYHLVPVTYQASVLMYVNNSSKNENSGSISSSDLNAAQSLVDTYIIILNSHRTMDEVTQKCALSYSYGQMKKMIEADAVDGTEIFKVTVTSGDVDEAVKIANTIAAVLPVTIAEVVEGSSVRIVDYAEQNQTPYSPNYVWFLFWGCFLGMFITTIIVVIVYLMDEKIYDEETLLRIYDAPVLAKIPNFNVDGKKKRKYGTYQEKGGERT